MGALLKAKVHTAFGARRAGFLLTAPVKNQAKNLVNDCVSISF
jgi:hypothetical protein